MRFVPQASSPLNAIGINPGQVEERQYDYYVEAVQSPYKDFIPKVSAVYCQTIILFGNAIYKYLYTLWKPFGTWKYIYLS